ncbi:periaxin-like isoform X4 [Lethenteron reissneri]|uniref:periaxin-like isoform X4 n=1 Tax=Lethenteron reissneri TaxID=7753 RepID=UPI002AB695AB|nr:periaxin-like isoform X4 [Lethenteron reissneri]
MNGNGGRFWQRETGRQGPETEESRGPETEEVPGPEMEEVPGPETEETEGPETEEVPGPETEETQGPEMEETQGLEMEEVLGPETEETKDPETEETEGLEMEEVLGPETEETKDPETEETEGPEMEETEGPEMEEVPGPETEETEGPGMEEVPGPEMEEVPGPEMEETWGPEMEEIPGPETEETEGPDMEEVPGPEIEETEGPVMEETQGPGMEEGEFLLHTVAMGLAGSLRADVLELEMSIEAMLSRMEELCGMLDMVRRDTHSARDDALPRLHALVPGVRLVFARIEQLEGFVRMLQAGVSCLEEQLNRAERELTRRPFPATIRRLLSQLGSVRLTAPPPPPRDIDHHPRFCDSRKVDPRVHQARSPFLTLSDDAQFGDDDAQGTCGTVWCRRSCRRGSLRYRRTPLSTHAHTL